MNNWYQQQEQSAGSFRLEILWFVYKAFGIRALKLLLFPVSFIITLFAKPARIASKQYRTVLNKYAQKHNLSEYNFTSFKHIRAFANTLVDKLSANCDSKTRIKITIKTQQDWKNFESIINKNKGVFLICSHLGNIEALSAIPQSQTKNMHAFMQVGQSKTFHRFMMKHNKNQNTVLHPTEEIDISIAGTMYDNLCRGNLVMMAGDRVSATTPSKTIPATLLDCECCLPVGVFKFARSMSHPVFAISLINTGLTTYELHLKELDTTTIKSMAQEYIRFIEPLILRHPTQWFNFYNYFNQK